MFYPSDFKHNKQFEGFKANSSWKEYLNGLLDEYCKNGSLHGLKYIREPSIPRVERLMWMGIIGTFFFFSWVALIDFYNESINHSFSLDIHPYGTPIWEVPFPAVAVCPAYRIRKSVFDLEKETNNTKYRFFSKTLCDNKLAFGTEQFNEALDEEFFEFIHKASIPCKDLIVNCRWNLKKRDCCSYFKPILTPFGYCHVFNNLPGSRKYKHFSPPPGVTDRDVEDFMFWSLSEGYPKRDGREAKLVRPLWSETAGPFNGLVFDLVDVREESQELCSGQNRGFQLAVYPPNENFESETVIRIPHNEHTFIKLSPHFMNSESSLRSIQKEDRECVFEDEISLDYFRYYSQATCRLECYLQKALKRCGCVIMSARRFLGTFNYPYCNASQYPCMSEELSNVLITPLVKINSSVPFKKCMCPPGCSALNYDIQTGFEQIVTPTTLPPWAKDYNKSVEETFARVSVYFSHQQFNTIDRKRTSTLGTFLGSCGGLLSLFLGFSFMSLFEVFYFAIIRPLSRITLHRLADALKQV